MPGVGEGGGGGGGGGVVVAVGASAEKERHFVDKKVDVLSVRRILALGELVNNFETIPRSGTKFLLVVRSAG